jgi:hypothetical protein
MPSSSTFVKGLLAAIAVVACMFYGNYRALQAMPTQTHGDTYIYEAVESPQKLKPLEIPREIQAPQLLKGAEGASETVRLSFSAHLHAGTLKENTKVHVFLVKEVGVPPAARVLLFTRRQDDGSNGVVSTESKSGENGKSTALRALATHAGVNPVPDLDFITPVGATSDGDAVYVAYIRQERLHLKGRKEPVDGTWEVFKTVKLAAALQEATVSCCSFAALEQADACLQGLARAYLNPWFKTAGLPPGSCG